MRISSTWRWPLLCLLLLTAGPVRGQSLGDADFTFGATFQGRFSYGWRADGVAEDPERLGFGLRRVRLRGAAVFGRPGAYVQVGAVGAAVEPLDAYAFYAITPRLQVRLGRFAPAQPRAYQLTSHTRIDALERAVIANRWGENTLAYGGRDFGLDLLYEADRATLQLTLHNGTGSWDRLFGNFRSGIRMPTDGGDGTGMAASLYGAYRPAMLSDLEVGAYVGYNAAEPPSTRVESGFFEGTPRSYVSYSGHLYWGAIPGSRPVRLKLDVIGIRYEALTVPPTVYLLPGAQLTDAEQHVLGLSLLGAVRVHPSAEVFARIEQYDANMNADGRRTRYLTAGGSFSLSALRGGPYRAQRLTLAYGAAFPEGAGARRHLLALQLQLVF